MSKELLIVFVKNPRLGKVKTRLAESIGDQKALKIYQILLDHTLLVTQNLFMDKTVYYSDFIPANDSWKKAGFSQQIQTGNDLGEKMSNAFRAAFIKGYDKVVLIGSDCYDLEESHLKSAFYQLEKKQVVLGPAVDGGYYLIGMTEHFSDLFKNKKWSSSTVFNDTFTDILNQNLTAYKLHELSDIDDLKDLIKYENLFNLL